MHAVLAGQRVQAECLPGWLGAFHNARANPGCRGVSVEPDPPGRGLFESEGKTVEHLLGAQPQVGIAADSHAGTEMIAATLAHPAIRAIAHHHEVGVTAGGGELVDLATVLHLNPEVGGTLGENIEQRRAAYAEAISRQIGRLFAAQDYLLLLPQHRCIPNGPGAVAIV